jgi:hypothetical protein
MCLVPDSTNLAAIGYHRADKVMRVRFHDGSEYELAKVKLGAYLDLVGAESIGSHFAAHFRGRHPTWRMKKRRPAAHKS